MEDMGMTAPDVTAPTEPVLSLVITTLGRVAELTKLFDSLAQQSFKSFDVWLVDQNDDDRLAPLVAAGWPFTVNRCHVPTMRGASRGRNHGWRLSRGRLVLFPDDDCWYGTDFLERGVTTMAARGCDMLAGRAADESGRTINGRFERSPQWVERRTVWTSAIEWLVFFDRQTLTAVDGFDEAVGIGASTPWQSAEIQDIILRAMATGRRCWYDPALTGHHEEIVVGHPDHRALRKTRIYARGMGYVLRRHKVGIPALGKWLARPLAGAALAVSRGRFAIARHYGSVAIGRLEGAVGKTFGR